MRCGGRDACGRCVTAALSAQARSIQSCQSLVIRDLADRADRADQGRRFLYIWSAYRRALRGVLPLRAQTRCAACGPTRLGAAARVHLNASSMRQSGSIVVWRSAAARLLQRLGRDASRRCCGRGRAAVCAWRLRRKLGWARKG